MWIFICNIEKSLASLEVVVGKSQVIGIQRLYFTIIIIKIAAMKAFAYTARFLAQ